MPETHVSGTVVELIEFLGVVADRPDLNSTTIQAMRSAWHSVTAELGIPPSTFVQTLQPDDLVDQFERRRGPNFRSGATYRTRLRVGQQLFLAWQAKDPEWMDIARTRTPNRPGSLNSSRAGRSPIRVLQFPLRRDTLINIEIPVDLTSSEAERVAAFLRSCVVPDETGAGYEEAPAT